MWKTWEKGIINLYLWNEFEDLCLNVVTFSFFSFWLFFFFNTSLAGVKGMTEKTDAEHMVSGDVKVKPVLC